MSIALELPDELVEALRVIVRAEVAGVSPWCDLAGAAEYAAMTKDAVESARKRGQLQAHRSATGRIRYHRDDLDAFLRAGNAS